MFYYLTPATLCSNRSLILIYTTLLKNLLRIFMEVFGIRDTHEIESESLLKILVTVAVFQYFHVYVS